MKFVGIGPVWKRFSGEMIDMNTLNEYVDFWYYEIGVNPIPAITTNKQTGKSPHPFGILHYEWNDASYNLRDDPIPEELFQHLKSENHYNQGIAIAGGLIHRGIHQGRYLILVDADTWFRLVILFYLLVASEEVAITIILKQPETNIVSVWSLIRRFSNQTSSR